MPLLWVLFSIIVTIGFLVAQKINLEKNAWVFQTKKTHSISWERTQDYVFSATRSRLDFSYVTSKLPWSFRVMLGLNPSKQQKVSWNGRIWKFPEIHIESYIQFPGKNLKDDLFFQKALWQEVMNQSKFYYPLSMLGIKEIREASIPIRFIDWGSN